MRIERVYAASQEINDAEHKWWNTNAQLVSKVWEMNSIVSWSIRKRYLRKARRFFWSKTKPATILELGCGSGWVGQFLASPVLRIIGTDYSESQIALSVSNAHRKGLNSYCRYFVANSSEWPKETRDVAGVLIHSFLHHLDKNEIDELFSKMQSTFAKGTKVWIYEPAFYTSRIANEENQDKVGVVLEKFASAIVNILSRVYRKYNLIDMNAKKSFEELVVVASKNEWYLSPKEVPFIVEDFTAKLNETFEVNTDYWGTINIVGWVHETNLIKSGLLLGIFNFAFVHLLAYVDAKLSKRSRYNRRKLVAPNYAFHIWECELR